MKTHTITAHTDLPMRTSNAHFSSLMRSPRLAIAVSQIVAAVVFVVLWEIASGNRWIDPLFFGTPSKIFDFLYINILETGTLLKDLAWTLSATALAFMIGSCLGILTGLVFVMVPFTEKFLDPFFSALNALPRVALAPLFLLWFGLGIGSKVALGASLTFFIVLSSAVAGARSVDRDFLTLAKTLGASPSTVFFKITIISAIPTLFAGLRMGLIYALLGVIAGEMLAAQHGLGQQISVLAGSFQADGVFAVLVVLAFVGLALMHGMSAIESVLIRWR